MTLDRIMSLRLQTSHMCKHKDHKMLKQKKNCTCGASYIAAMQILFFRDPKGKSDKLQKEQLHL